MIGKHGVGQNFLMKFIVKVEKQVLFSGLVILVNHIKSQHPWLLRAAAGKCSCHHWKITRLNPDNVISTCGWEPKKQR